jgi:hypothetical protein
MTTDSQKTLAALASLASVLVGVVTVASYFTGDDVDIPVVFDEPNSSDQIVIIVHARAVFQDDGRTYVLDNDKNLMVLNDSMEVVT